MPLLLRDSLIKIGSEIDTARGQPFTKHPLANFIREDFRQEIQSLLDTLVAGLVVDASPGKGNWADVPWLAVFNPQITTSAKQGYYPVYLFAHEQPYIYLSLNQGSEEIPNNILENRADIMRIRLKDFSMFNAHFIELNSRHSRPKGYEHGHSLGKKYSLASLPSEKILRKDLTEMIRAYLSLQYRGDTEILPESSLATQDSNKPEDRSSRGINETIRYVVHKRIERVSGTGEKVKRHHGTVCQGCNFDFTDTYGELGQGYIEAHHLRPLSSLNEGQSLIYNIETDFAVLCANCHRMIHRCKDPSNLEIFRQIIKSTREKSLGQDV